MSVYAIVGISAIIAVLSILLKKYSPEYSMLMIIMTGIFLIFNILKMLNPVLSEIKRLSENLGIFNKHIFILLKVLAIAFLTQFSSETCIDAGQTSLASKIELAGKVLILLAALPLLKEVINIIVALVR